MKGEFQFWFWMHVLFVSVGGTISAALGSAFWVGALIALFILWGIPLCLCVFD